VRAPPRRPLSSLIPLTTCPLHLVTATSASAAASTVTMYAAYPTDGRRPPQFGHIVEDSEHSVESGLHANVVTEQHFRQLRQRAHHPGAKEHLERRRHAEPGHSGAPGRRAGRAVT
jgi:hypothetical protein